MKREYLTASGFVNRISKIHKEAKELAYSEVTKVKKKDEFYRKNELEEIRLEYINDLKRDEDSPDLLISILIKAINEYKFSSTIETKGDDHFILFLTSKIGELYRENAGDLFECPTWKEFTVIRENLFVFEVLELINSITSTKTETAEPDKIVDYEAFRITIPKSENLNLYDALIKGGYIEASTPQTHFDYYFHNAQKPTDIKPLKWNKSKQLLGWFVDSLCEKYTLYHGKNRKIKPFEIIFNTPKINGMINEYKKIGVSPLGYKEIDVIISSL